jgi:hypothetical protein
MIDRATIDSFLIRQAIPIVNKLISENLINIDQQKVISSFIKNNNIVIKKNNERFDITIDKEYFFVGINYIKGIDNSESKNILTSLKNEFTLWAKLNNRYHGIDLHISEFEPFFNKYHSNKFINWSSIYLNENINWSIEFLKKNAAIIDWEFVHQNPKISWSFKLIEGIEKYLNWAYISSYPSLHWDIEKINKYKDYLIFKNEVNEEFDVIEPAKKNNKGQIFYIKGRYSGCFSKSANADWNANLIYTFKDYLDWSEILSNPNINWNIDLLETFKDYFEQEKLPDYGNMEFNSEPINLSIKKSQFAILSLNEGHFWSEDILDFYFDVLNWRLLSGNKSIPWSNNLIRKYSNKWYWKRVHDSKKINQNETDLSTNYAIFWDKNLLEEFSEKLDFWYISLHGKMEWKCLLKLHKYFDEKHCIRREEHRWSDYNPEYFAVFSSCWENLANNSNFSIDIEIIEFLYNRMISCEYTTGNLANDGEIKTIDVRILEKLKNCRLVNITMFDIIQNEFGWSNILIQPDFINQSLWDNIISPVFTKEYLNKYLNHIQN